MGAVQRLATVVVLGLVGMASVLILYLADEPNRLDSQAEEQIHDAVERGTQTYLSQCLACHGPAGEGYTAPGESGTGRIGAPLGGDTPNRLLNQTGIVQTGPNAGKPWSDPNNPQWGSGLEGRANFIRYRIHNGMRTSDGTYLMPAFGEELNGPLNDAQIDELVTFIQHADWNEVYNEAIELYGGYPTPAPSEAAATPVSEASPIGGPGEGTVIELGMIDTAFEETELRIPANTDVVINAVNKGALPHTFTITDVVDTGEVPSGGNQEVTLNLPPGEYEFFCAVPGHREAGMVGRLIVEEGAEAVQPTDATPAAGTPAAQDGGQGETAGGPIEVDMVELAFNPAELTIPANTDVTIHAVNAGALPHTFTLPEQGIDTGEVASGASADVTVNLPPGEYRYICTVPGHADGGMVGTLIVE